MTWCSAARGTSSFARGRGATAPPDVPPGAGTNGAEGVIPLPSAVPGRRVNAYALAGGRALVDPGPGTDEAHLELEAALSDRGLALADVEAVFVTHGHASHSGGAGRVAAATGARVLCHPVLAPGLADPVAAARGARVHLARVARAAGVLPEFTDAAVADIPAPGAAVPEEHLLPVRHGDRVALAGASWEAHHVPGHSPDSVGLLERRRGILVAGDLLLRHDVTRMALEAHPVDRPATARLDGLVASWRAVGRLPVDELLPGHGPPVRAHRVLVARQMAELRSRLATARQAVREGAVTVWEVVLATWPVPPSAALPLVLGDTIGLLEWLNDRGAIERTTAHGVVEYRPVPARRRA